MRAMKMLQKAISVSQDETTDANPVLRIGG